MNHGSEFKPHLSKLVQLVDSGKLRVLTDSTDEQGKPFIGLESVFDAIDVSYCYSQCLLAG